MNRWVDTRAYFGADRRKVRAGFRLRDRRRVDEAGELAPLGALLRRVRVQLMDLSSDDTRKLVMTMLMAAIGSAEIQGRAGCARALTEAVRALNTAPAMDRPAIKAADTCVAQAQALV